MTKKIKLAGISILAALVAILLGSMLLHGPSGNAAGPPGRDPAAPGLSSTSVYSVKTVVLKTGDLRDYLDLTGDVVTETNVDVFPDVGGKLASIAKVGDQAVKGKTLIAEVDPSKPGSSYALSPVYSPITGTVTSVAGQLGATVTTQTSLATVGVLSALYVDSNVPETQVAQVRVGLKADVTFEAFPGEIFSATVTRVSPVVDATSRTKTIRLRFVRQPSQISLGMFAEVKLLFDPRPAKVLVPQESILSRGGKSFAFVVERNKAVRREVVQGLLVDGTVEVESGLRAGEILVVKGQELLDDGSVVRVVNP